jgi:hypothetical protein
VTLANTNLQTATQTVTEATAALAEATTARNTLRATIDALQATLTSLGNQLAKLIDDLVGLLDELLRIIPSINLADLLAAIEDLIDGLAGLQLLAIDEIAVGVTTKATGTGSSATALCTVKGVELLGAAREVASCEALQTVLAQLDAVISDLLAGLPIAASVAGGVSAAALPDDIVRVRGLTTTVSPADQRDGDYYTASSAVRALDIDVQPLRLTQVTDGLLAEVTGLVDGALAQLGDLAGVDTSVLQGQLTGLVTDLTAALPVGDLTGVLTPALELEVLGIVASSSFAAAGPAATPIGGTPPGSVAPTAPGAGTPQTTAPTSPTPSGTLPRTGGGMGLAALLLLGIGGGSVYALRRRPAA